MGEVAAFLHLPRETAFLLHGKSTRVWLAGRTCGRANPARPSAGAGPRGRSLCPGKPA